MYVSYIKPMREQILNLAEKQMLQGGYDTLSFSVIAKTLETTRANLHYHFKNKESLGIEVTKRFMADEMADMKKICAAYPGDFCKQMNAFEDYYWRIVKEEGCGSACVACQIVRSPNSPEILVDLAKSFFEERFEFSVQQVIESQEAGTLRKDLDPVSIATQGVALMMGLMQLTQGLMTIEEAEKRLRGTIKAWTQTIRA